MRARTATQLGVLISTLPLAACLSPLEKAVKKCDAAAVKNLIDQGAPVNQHISTAGSETLLHWVAFDCDVKTAQLLLAHGAEIDAVDNAGWTPLMNAAQQGRTEMVKLLLARGANADIKDNTVKHYTALDWALDGKQTETSRVLREWQAGRLATTEPSAPAPIPEAAQPDRAQPSASRESAVDIPSYSNAARPHDFALVIGISKYRDIPEAQFAEADARAVKKHLLALGYPERNIITLIGDRATKSTLTDKIETWLPMNVKDDSTVFVYYSGHGAPDAESRRAYLVPWDGDPESLKSTAYPVTRLYEKLEALKAKRVIVALDSCFSGAGGRSVLAKGARPLVTKIDAGELSTGKVAALTASSLDQISGSFEEEGHGTFTYFLLKGLNGDAADKDGRVTLGSLFNYLSPQVQDEAHRHEREQTPQLLPASGDQASFVLR